jgi:hypothetical protein
MPIQLRLEVGDALQWPADLAWIGTEPLLRQRVEALSGQRFAPLDLRDFGRAQRGHGNLLAGVDLLVAPGFAWKQVLSVRSRPSRRTRASHVDTMDTVTGLVRRVMRPQLLLLVPWRHAPAEQVAKSMLFHLWRMHRYAHQYGARMAPDEIAIIDLHDVGIFRDLVGPRRDELQAFIDAQRGGGAAGTRDRRADAVLFECV